MTTIKISNIYQKWTSYLIDNQYCIVLFLTTYEVLCLKRPCKAASTIWKHLHDPLVSCLSWQLTKFQNSFRSAYRWKVKTIFHILLVWICILFQPWQIRARSRRNICEINYFLLLLSCKYPEVRSLPSPGQAQGACKRQGWLITSHSPQHSSRLPCGFLSSVEWTFLWVRQR